MLRITICLLIVSTVCPVRGEQPEDFLETLPAKAAASFTVRNLEELNTHYQKHLKRETDFGFKQLVTMGLSFLKIHQGVDWDGTFSLVLMESEESKNYEVMLQSLVLRVPFTDAEAMAQNFQLTPGDLEDDTIHVFEKRFGNRHSLCVKFQERSVLLSLTQEAIEQYLDSKGLKSVVVSDPGRRLSRCDVLLQVNPGAIDPESYEKQIREWVDEMFADEPEELRERIRSAVLLVDHSFVSLNLDDGVHVRVQCNFSRTLPDEIQQALEKYAEPSTMPDLKGLPPGKLLLALSKAADREQNAAVQDRATAWLLQRAIRNRSVTSLVLPYLDPRSETFHGLIDEIWNSIVEARLAVYLNDDVHEQGLANLLVVLHPETPEGLTEQLTSLVKFSRGGVYNPRTKRTEKVTDAEIRQLIGQMGSVKFPERKSATLRLKLLGERALPFLEQSAKSRDVEVARRSKSVIEKIRKTAAHHAELLIKEGMTRLPLPEFVLYEEQLELVGYPADVLVAQWAESDLSSPQRVRELAGPHGHEILVVHVEDQIVLFWGSDRSLLKECLKRLKSGEPGLNRQRSRFARHAAPRRLVESHLSLQRLSGLVPEAFPGRAPATGVTDDFSSFGIRISPRHLIGDASFPLPEFQLIARYFLSF